MHARHRRRIAWLVKTVAGPEPVVERRREMASGPALSDDTIKQFSIGEWYAYLKFVPIVASRQQGTAA